MTAKFIRRLSVLFMTKTDDEIMEMCDNQNISYDFKDGQFMRHDAVTKLWDSLYKERSLGENIDD